MARQNFEDRGQPLTAVPGPGVLGTKHGYDLAVHRHRDRHENGLRIVGLSGGKRRPPVLPGLNPVQSACVNRIGGEAGFREGNFEG